MEEEEVAMVQTVFMIEARTYAAQMDDNEGDDIREGEQVDMYAYICCTQQFTCSFWKCTTLSKISKSTGCDWIDLMEECSLGQ